MAFLERRFVILKEWGDNTTGGTMTLTCQFYGFDKDGNLCVDRMVTFLAKPASGEQVALNDPDWPRPRRFRLTEISHEIERSNHTGTERPFINIQGIEDRGQSRGYQPIR